jgi:hypothetical protein
MDKNWFQKLAKSIRKITKNSIAFLKVQCIGIFYKYCYCLIFDTSVPQFYGNFFSFKTQKYQNYRCQAKRTGPNCPTLPYIRKQYNLNYIVIAL